MNNYNNNYYLFILLCICHFLMLSPTILFQTKALNIFWGIVTTMYKGPLFSIETFDTLGIQLATMLCFIFILCESGGTPRMVATSNEGLIKIEVPHIDSKVNQKTISNNQSWYLLPNPLSSWTLITCHQD